MNTVFNVYRKIMIFNKPNYTLIKLSATFFNTLCPKHNKVAQSRFFSIATLLFIASILAAFPNAKTDELGFTVSLSKQNIKPGDTFEIIITGNVPHGFHLYSEKSDCPDDDGPLRAEWSFEISNQPGFELIGKPIGIGDKMVMDDEIFKCSTGEFEDHCEFRQKVKAVHASNSVINAAFNGQKCSTDGTCFLVKESISIPILIL